MFKHNKKLLVIFVGIFIASFAAGFGGAHIVKTSIPKKDIPAETVAQNSFNADASAVEADSTVGLCINDIDCSAVIKKALPTLQELADAIIKAKFADISNDLQVLRESDTTHAVIGLPADAKQTMLPDGSTQSQLSTSFKTTAISRLQKEKWFVGIEGAGANNVTDESSKVSSIRKSGNKILFTSAIKEVPSQGFCKAYTVALIVYYSPSNTMINKTDKQIDTSNWYFSSLESEDPCGTQ